MYVNTTPHIYLYNLYRKDVRLPVQLQRAMAAEAEASREAKAKVGRLQSTWESQDRGCQ